MSAESRQSAGAQLSADAVVWPRWHRVVFRFFFVYLALRIAPWHWLDGLFGLGAVTRPLNRLNGWAVELANKRLFHVRDVLVPVNGSGDTSFAWTELWLYLSLAALACVAWSLIDRKSTAYPRLEYWLRTFVRYYIATFALSYGIIKLFFLQMSFPALSQLSTPLGDLLPMRLSWLFIGYSHSYQLFSGLMETTAGLLLLNRKTITLGLIAATGAFLNVVMINLAYDVPVKLFAMHLLFACLFLLAYDFSRLFGFFVLNRAAPSTMAWEPKWRTPWRRNAAIAAKALLVWLILVSPFISGYKRYTMLAAQPDSRPFPSGVYDVRRYVLNHDTIPPLLTDSLRWRDVIIDSNVGGSVNTTDPVFWQRYRRGYFRYKADTAKHTVAVWKTSTALDSTYLFAMRYEIPDSATIRFWTKIRNDSVYVELVKVPRHFQLTERQFHWLSEYNR